MFDDCLWCPNQQRSAQVLRCIGTEESYGMLVLNDVVEIIATNLLQSRLSLCGDHLASHIPPDPQTRPGTWGVNRIDTAGLG